MRETFDGFVDQFEGMDGRMAERADDLQDVRDRLLRLLVDESATEPSQTDGPDADERIVLLADRLAPSDTADLDPDRIAGLVTNAGGRTSHAAILARSLAIPATTCSSTARTVESWSIPTARRSRRQRSQAPRFARGRSRRPTGNMSRWPRTSAERAD
ncbi:PEP-utilizing enzyme [Halostagnicola kamekurae]|uniref:PEP-utilizing enzyme n=1 Tax=Halostagnicola kamekurae TaxID=619731 RepID=UPI001FECBB71|nr:PEP-utilizing enzyme [Halostagnicola kamekurae]